MKKVTLLQIANVVILVLTLVMNGLAQSDLFPNTVGELGESRAVFFLPAGFVFGIWGIIYTGLIIYSIYQVRPSQRDGEVISAVSGWFILSSIANISWLVLFLFDFVWLSTLAMVVLLASLLMIYIRLGVGVRDVSLTEKWAVHIPFSIYLGWISVATIANFSTALYTSGAVTAFIGLNADLWASVMMIVAAVLAFGMLYFRRDSAYALVIVWATYGINARPFDTDLFSGLATLNANLVNTTALSIAVIVGVGAAIVTGMTVFRRN
ncbi:MAG: tryptophan-rich sensory protein [Anaerolineae bacterium]